MRVVNLGSGSKGNSYFIKAGTVKILIDAGLSLRDLETRLGLIGESVQKIDALLLTHEHSDHIRCFNQLMKKTNIHAYVHEKIADGLNMDRESFFDRVSKISIYPFYIDKVKITPVELPHDSIACLGYIIEYDKWKIGVVTDLGFMPINVLEKLYGSSLCYIESNHDRKMLSSCAYPWIVKERIRSEHGHLSNSQAAAVIVSLAKHGTKHFVLSHISQNSNTIELAYSESARALEEAGFELEKDVFIRYSRQDRPGNNYKFGEDNE